MSSIQEYADELGDSRRRHVRHQARQENMVWMSTSMAIRRKELVASLTRLIMNPDFADLSDMTIACQNERFRCHKAVVCAQSATIRNCCKESPVKGEGCIIKVKCHPLVFQMTLEYLYTCDYRFYLAWNFPTRFLAGGQTVPVDPIDRLDCCELSLHLQVHVLAQCLRIPGLKYLAAFNIVRVLQRTSFPTVFPRFVREVYKSLSTKNALVKRLVIDHADKVIRECRGRNHYDGRFPRYLFDELDEFASDFIAGRTVLDAPLDNYSTGDRICRKHWYC
ncbi:hypothetical protein BJX76DRAFT_368870 [Aspergillus varians]